MNFISRCDMLYELFRPDPTYIWPLNASDCKHWKATVGSYSRITYFCQFVKKTKTKNFVFKNISQYLRF